MEFFTQTIFAYLMLYYIWQRKNKASRKEYIFIALAAVVVVIYVVAYVYLLFKGELDWIKIVGLGSVLCFSALVIIFSLHPSQKN